VHRMSSPSNGMALGSAAAILAGGAGGGSSTRPSRRGGVVNLEGRAAALDQRAARAEIAATLDKRREEITASWMATVEEAARERFPDLDRYLRSLISGLYEVFRDDQWSLTQTIIDGLAERRARSGMRLEQGIQRALLAGRRSILQFCDSDDPVIDDLLLDVLHECLFRFFESYQGIRMASENDRLHTRIIKSLVMALEARDPYTKGHSISVALLAQKIAEGMDVPLDPERVYLAGLLHDVGKVGIPDAILLKPGPLTEEEWAVMQEHPGKGASILRPIKLYPDVVSAVLTHHENWDGSGYPSRLAGDDIPPIARILRVADSFNAMTSTRSHRPSRSIDSAIEELLRSRGEVYEPRAVEVLIDLVETPGAMRELNLASLQIDLGYVAV
jgi:putative nucleotidyltransferase with HDIG domain